MRHQRPRKQHTTNGDEENELHQMKADADGENPLPDLSDVEKRMTDAMVEVIGHITGEA